MACNDRSKRGQAAMKTKFMMLFVVCMGLVLPLYGQTFGGITGVVTDTSEAVIGGAMITLINPQTNFTRTVTSNEAGNYNLPNLPPGLYNIRAERDGFQTEV